MMTSSVVFSFARSLGTVHELKVKMQTSLYLLELGEALSCLLLLDKTILFSTLQLHCHSFCVFIMAGGSRMASLRLKYTMDFLFYKLRSDCSLFPLFFKSFPKSDTVLCWKETCTDG